MCDAAAPSRAAEATDWSAIWAGDFRSAAEFASSALEVVTIAGRGRGVRAKAALEPGALLLAERAVATAPEPELGEVLVKLQSRLPEETRLRLRLMCDGEPLAPVSQPVALQAWPPPELHKERPGEVSLQRMRRIVDLNAYRCAPPWKEYAFMPDDESAPVDDDETRHMVYGVFPLGSLVNHSCAPNVSKVLLGDWVFLRAAQRIEPGEEITQFYCDVRMPLQMRQKELLDLFGFQCDCTRCRFEEKVWVLSRDSIGPLEGLYSCQVPGFHPRRGLIQVSQLEGVLSEAEAAAQRAAQTYRHSMAKNTSSIAKATPDAKQVEQWLLWPLVPALSQLAERLRLNGRAAESVELWKRAETAASSVIPLSNVHLRTMSERLLTEAQRNNRTAVEVVAMESLLATAHAFGSGFAVWNQLVGFRLSSWVVDLASRLCTSLAPPAADVSKTSAAIECTLGSTCMDDTTGTRTAILIAKSTAFDSVEAIRLEASESFIVIGVEGAPDAQVRCPFRIDLERMSSKFSRKRQTLTVTLIEQTGSA
eukprot:TRINITY_DN47354_c0_g1_i1.p1 TRINITY_DN47354_c0_g1~~TRINITY_DN47354_c0_g1_i1.p1  ORF type:complete len:560 (-),score=81.05 TRINITY_DN47354_c0_g1_i1:228-1835(-)